MKCCASYFSMKGHCCSAVGTGYCYSEVGQFQFTVRPWRLKWSIFKMSEFSKKQQDEKPPLSLMQNSKYYEIQWAVMCYHYTALLSELVCPSVCLSVSTQTEPCTALLVATGGLSVVPARLLAERRQLRVVCDYHITVFYITTSIELSRAKAEPSKFTVNVGINRRRISEFHGKFQGLSCVLYCIFDSVQFTLKLWSCFQLSWRQIDTTLSGKICGSISDCDCVNGMRMKDQKQFCSSEMLYLAAK